MGREAAGVMKQMLQLATLVALRTREHGQKQAESRAVAENARDKEAREVRLREERDAKAKDPRGAELGRIMDSNAQNRGVSLDKTDSSGKTAVAKYDSNERRETVARHVYDDAVRNGRTPEEARHLANVRFMVEVGQAQPAREATRHVPDDTQRTGRGQEIEERGRARTRG